MKVETVKIVTVTLHSRLVIELPAGLDSEAAMLHCIVERAKAQLDRISNPHRTDPGVISVTHTHSIER